MRRRRMPERLPRDNMVIFMFGGAVSEEQKVTEIDADGPAAAQPRDASQKRAWNFITKDFKKAIKRVHVHFGQPPFQR